MILDSGGGGEKGGNNFSIVEKKTRGKKYLSNYHKESYPLTKGTKQWWGDVSSLGGKKKKDAD